MPSSDRPLPVEDLEDLYESAPCGYVSLTPDGRIAKANATLHAWTGHPPGGLVGLKLQDLLSIGQRIFYETHLAPLLRMQGSVSEVALELRAAAGVRLPVLANAAEKRDAEGRHLFTRLTFLKAIDRRQYERGLVEARAAAEADTRQQLAEAELREQFIAVLGHDLRNPLAAIASGARMIEDREELSARGQNILQLMQGSVTRAAGLIDDVLDFARGRLGGGLTLARDAGSTLGPVLEQVVEELRATAPDRTIESEIRLPDPVHCDPTRVAQLLSNLLGNAVTHGAADKPIRVRAIVTGDALEISIANGGDPIPAATMERLFHPFFRGEMRASREGLGLGLYIASEIARAHGGTLTAASDAGETRFTFRMPVNPA